MAEPQGSLDAGIPPDTRADHNTSARWLLNAGSPALWLALFVLAWIVVTWMAAHSPPVDNAEQLSWVRSLEWGYYKHPPLPTVLLWPLVKWLGIHEWTSFVAAALVACSALLVSRQLVLELCGRRFANLALLGTLCIGYYSHRVNYYNHDTLLLLSVTSSAWACWRAFDRRSLAYWALLGVCLGLGALAKYQVALAAAAVFVWWVARQGWRDRLHRQGLALCAAIALLIFSPHLIWAISHDFPTLRYALRSSLGAPLTLAQCSVGVIEWLGGQLAQFAGALLLGAALWWRGKRSAQQDPDAGTLAPPHPHARAFLLVWGLLPLALMAVIGLLFHAKLQRNWGTAYMPFCCAALMLWIGPRVWLQLRWRQALTGFALAQALLLAFALSAMSASKPTLNQQRWYRFASQEVADTIGPAARSLLGGRIRVIAGPQKLASVLALRLPERPLVLVDGSYEYSPWLPQDMSTMCGILWVGGPKDEAPYDVVRHDIDGGLWWAVEMVANDFSDCA